MDDRLLPEVAARLPLQKVLPQAQPQPAAPRPEPVSGRCLADGQMRLDGLGSLVRLRYVRHTHARAPTVPLYEEMFGTTVPYSEEHLGSDF